MPALSLLCQLPSAPLCPAELVFSRPLQVMPAPLCPLHYQVLMLVKNICFEIKLSY
jgi:hypothetical protein